MAFQFLFSFTVMVSGVPDWKIKGLMVFKSRLYCGGLDITEIPVICNCRMEPKNLSKSIVQVVLALGLSSFEFCVSSFMNFKLVLESTAKRQLHWREGHAVWNERG